MKRHAKIFLAVASSAVLYCQAASGQFPRTANLIIDFQNRVGYNYDVADYSKFATNSAIQTRTPAKNFGAGLWLGDIVAVNGKAVKGAYVERSTFVNLTATPTPGQAIGDTTRSVTSTFVVEILQTDGTPVGAIVASGLSGGSLPPGAAATATGGSWAITGGTGAFLGVRGQATGGGGGTPVSGRETSVTEDPANRRANGGGARRVVLQLIPLYQPQILAVAHSTDFTAVTASQPAAAGEIVSVVATGLGPCRAADSPTSLPTVNSPVDVTVNGNPAKVLAAVCYSGQVEGYQINFQVPAGTAKGPAALQVSAAWIPAPAVTLAVQ